jgi:hypothetical protein
MGNKKQATRSKGTETGWRQKDFDLMQIFKRALSLSVCVCVVPFREIVFK